MAHIRQKFPQRACRSRMAAMEPRSSSPAKTARIRQGLSLRDVAAVVGRSHMWVHLVENGRIAISADDRESLAEALGIDLSDMPVREDFEP